MGKISYNFQTVYTKVLAAVETVAYKIGYSEIASDWKMIGKACTPQFNFEGKNMLFSFPQRIGCIPRSRPHLSGLGPVGRGLPRGFHSPDFRGSVPDEPDW